MPGQCCVFQLFDDGGAYDKRYDEVIRPAITAAGLEPYRVDRDAGAEIPIDTLHEEIRRSLVCLADITPDNPNVWVPHTNVCTIQPQQVGRAVGRGCGCARAS